MRELIELQASKLEASDDAVMLAQCTDNVDIDLLSDNAEGQDKRQLQRPVSRTSPYLPPFSPLLPSPQPTATPDVFHQTPSSEYTPLP